MDEEVLDNPEGWVARHIRRYVETGGRSGHKWRGKDSLLLTTRGRRSGKLRRTALFYGRDGDRYVLVASGGGEPSPPSWYLNLVEHPAVVVQVGADTFGALARTPTAEERPPLWRMMVAIHPRYETYRARAGRDLPVVILERAELRTPRAAAQAIHKIVDKIVGGEDHDARGEANARASDHSGAGRGPARGGGLRRRRR